MMKFKYFGILFVIILCFGGCSYGTNLNLSPIDDPTKRFEYKGFSILPPKGDKWLISKYNNPTAKWQTVFGKKLRETEPIIPEEAETVLATVAGIELPKNTVQNKKEFFEQLMEYRRLEANTGRIRLISLRFVTENYLGAECIKFDISAEDRGVRQFPNAIFIINNHGIYCLHPDSKSYLINLEYSQRYLKETKPSLIDSEGDFFLKSIEFTKLGG